MLFLLINKIKLKLKLKLNRSILFCIS